MRILLFLLINFLALFLGGLFTGAGVPSDWYNQLNKAPWTPPGWVFGAAWTTIMIMFAFYLNNIWNNIEDKKVLILLINLQWVLNVSWNPAFFYFHQVGFALVLIVLLTILIGFFFFNYWSVIKFQSLFILPYLIWLMIATSLNAYIFLKN